jgi:hypothetical protein
VTAQSEADLTLAAYQQDINEQFQRFRQTSGAAAGMKPSPEKLPALIDVIDMLTRTLGIVIGYAARAVRSRELGYPELAVQLESAARDIEGAVQVYAATYEDTLAVLQASWQVPVSADRPELRRATDAAAAAQREFAAAMSGGGFSPVLG